MSCIFIGYRRDDGGHARAVYQHLSLWFDQKDVFLDHESLCPSEKFRPALATAIESSQIFLSVIGPHWFSEKNRQMLLDPQDVTRGEIRTALEKQMPILPILCGAAQMPPKDQLPEDIAGLCDFQAHTLADRTYTASLNQLVDALRDRCGLKPRYRPPHGVSQACYLGDQKLSTYFADPIDALEKLRRILSDAGSAAVVGQATLHGMGGVGKTQLALKYSQTYQDQYAGVWWFKAETLMQLEQDFRYFCDANQVGLFEGEAPHQAVSRFLREQPRWLLVFDNAEAEYGDNQDRLRPYLPGGDHHLIITSRASDAMSGAKPLALDVWTEDEALLFLKMRFSKESENDLRRLSRTLGGLPLALEQACAYLLKTGNSIDAYCAAIEDLDRCKGHLERQAARENGYPYSVIVTLSLAFDRLSDGAKDLLRLCAGCAPEPIPESLFRLPAAIRAFIEKKKGDIPLSEEQQEKIKNLLPEALFKVAADDLLWGETVAELIGFALAQRVEIDLTPLGEKQSKTERALLMHRLTQAAVIHRLGHGAEDVPTLIELLRRLFPEDVVSPTEWPFARVLAPHVLAMEKRFDAGNVPQQNLIGPLSWLLDRLATYLQKGPALYDKAIAIFLANLERRKGFLRLDHPDTLASINNLALTLLTMGNHRGARELFAKVLELTKAKLGPDHPATLKGMGNIAATLLAMGDHQGARALFEQILELSKSMLGSEHPDTLTSMNNLAGALEGLGDRRGARALFEQVLTIRKAKLGPDHPATLTSMNNLASTLRAMGDHQGARALFEHVLELMKVKIGPDHPLTLTGLGNLASTLRAMGDNIGAQALEEQVLELSKIKLGPDHPDTLTSMGNLSLTLNAVGDHRKARTLQEQVLERRKTVIGQRHPSTTIAAWNLFKTLHEMNEHASAQAIIDENLAWLLDNKVELHSAQQRQIRDMLRQVVRSDKHD